MIRIYSLENEIPLLPEQLADEANAITTSKPFTPEMFVGKKSRISGSGHCDCQDGGMFVLLPLDDISVQESGKRYMRCLICGGISHL